MDESSKITFFLPFDLEMTLRLKICFNGLLALL